MKNNKTLLIKILFIWAFSLQVVYPHMEGFSDQRNGHNNQNLYKQKFSEVLLIIHFNHPHYGNIDFLKNLYSPIFEHIIFYGEKPDHDVFNVYTHIGFLLSDVVHDVLTRFPHYKGYLFLQDDCVLNIWNYFSLDFNKIWYAVKFNDSNVRNDKFYSIKNFNGQSFGLPWGKWDWQWGFNASMAAFEQLSTEDLHFLNLNVGKNNIPAQMCEVFYIPEHFKESMLRLTSIFKNVFCEIAVPSMLCCLDVIENWEQLDMFGGQGIGYGGINSPALQKYPLQVHWIHPMKFSEQKNRDGIAAIFKQMLS